MLKLSLSIVAMLSPASTNLQLKLSLALFLQNLATPIRESLILAMQTVRTVTMAINIIGRMKLGFG